MFYVIDTKTNTMTQIEKAIARKLLDGETEPEKKEGRRGRPKKEEPEPETKKGKGKEKDGGKTLNGIGYRETVYLVKRNGEIVKGKVFQILNGDTFRVAYDSEDGTKYANGKNAFRDKAEAKAFVKGGMSEPETKKGKKEEPETKKGKGKKKEEPETKKGKKGKKCCGNCALFETPECSYETFADEEPCDEYSK